MSPSGSQIRILKGRGDVGETTELGKAPRLAREVGLPDAGGGMPLHWQCRRRARLTELWRRLLPPPTPLPPYLPGGIYSHRVTLFLPEPLFLTYGMDSGHSAYRKWRGHASSMTAKHPDSSSCRECRVPSLGGARPQHIVPEAVSEAPVPSGSFIASQPGRVVTPPPTHTQVERMDNESQVYQFLL